MRAPRVCFLITEDWYFWSHRRNLAQHLLNSGCSVDLVTNLDKLEPNIRTMGIVPHSLGLRRRGKNPLLEMQTIQRIVAIFREIKPDVVHLVGMKPILYGSMAARLVGVPTVVCAVAGLGWLFTPGGPAKAMARRMIQAYYRLSLAGRDNVRFILQNTEHRELLVKRRMATEGQVDLIPGAGVDTKRFAYTSESQDTPTVLTHARMLWDKGIGEVVEAARLLKKNDIKCKFVLVGDPDPANPASIPKQQLEAWNQQGIVRWYPRRDDIPQLLSQAHIACLPSYHEGFPLSLVEAAACGRPIVTTDIPGCRDVVEDGSTGILVPKKNSDELAVAIAKLALNGEMRQEMGRRGRQRASQQMSCEVVNRKTFDCYQRAWNKVEVTNPIADAPPVFERRAA